MSVSYWHDTLRQQIVSFEDQSRSTKDLRFYQVDVLLRHAAHTEALASQCVQCRANKALVEQVVADLPHYFDGSAGGRRRFEQAFYPIEEHLRQAHGFARAHYYKTLFVFLGMTIGMLFGAALGWVVNPNALVPFLFVGWTLGYAAGYFRGQAKERLLAHQNRYL